MEETSSPMSIEEYLRLNLEARKKLYYSREFPDLDYDAQVEAKTLPPLKYGCHFPDLAMSSKCPFLEKAVACTNVDEWINCEEVILKRKLELNQSSKEFDKRKQEIQDQENPKQSS